MYRTTDEFLESFGLSRLAELPKLKEISEHHSMISLLESIFPGVENGKPEPKPPPHMRKEHIPPNSSDSDQTEKGPPPADLEDSELSDNIKVVAKFKEDKKP